MFIEPMQGMTGIAGSPSVFTAAPSGNAGVSLFRSIFEDSINNVIESDALVAKDVQALASGETDDLHTLGIDQTKAQLSVSLLVQVRNRFVDAYNELMRINL